MIISCNNCNKKFEVNSTLIPDLGRNIQCGSCEYTWFYKKDLIISEADKEVKNNQLSEEQNIVNTSKSYEGDHIDQDQSNEHKKINDTLKTEKKTKSKKSTGGTPVKILSYLIVGIISFTALVIFLDTFRLFFTKIIPGLELFLFNLFETLKDIFLFIKNLVV